MAETVFATLGEYGFKLTTLTGASGTLVNVKAVGTQRSSAANPKRVLECNYQNKLMFESVDHSTRRGLCVAIFNQDMNATYVATFDFIGNANSFSSFIARIQSLKDTEIAVITSMDSFTSSAELDTFFAQLRSVSWPNTGYFTKSDINKQSSYAAVICGKKKHIVAEKFLGHGAAEPDAVIDLSFSEPTTIGYSGYGEMLISDEQTTQSSGTAQIVKAWMTNKPLTDLGLKVGDSFVFQSLGEINDIANSTGTYLSYEVTYNNSSGAAIRSNVKDVYSVEGWEMVEIRDQIPVGCTSITVRAKMLVKSGSPSGTVYVKNTTMQTADNSFAETSTVSFGLYGTSTKSYEDSLGNFGHYDPTAYYKAYYSNDNLLRGLDIQQNTIEPVRWFNKVLDANNERLVISSSGQATASVGSVPIDPKKWYYTCVWVNMQKKTSGNMGIRFSSMDGTGKALTLTATDGSSSAAVMYAQNPPFDMLEERQWYLMQGFLLPYNVDRQKAIEFIETNKEFYGWDDLYGNGIGLSDEGTGNYGWINNQQCVKGSLVYDDTGNTSASKTLWALPILKELSIGSVDIDDGVLTSISLGS